MNSFTVCSEGSFVSVFVVATLALLFAAAALGADCLAEVDVFGALAEFDCEKALIHRKRTVVMVGQTPAIFISLRKV